MKTTRMKDMKNLSILALLMAVITFAACSSDEMIIDEQPAERTFTLVVNAAKGDAATRALTLEGTTLKATWAEGEAVTVYNVTKSAALTGTLTAQSTGTSTTLVGSLTGTIVNGDVLKLKFLSPSYTSQNGTLASIATTCDYAEATVNVTDASTSTVTTSNAKFDNQQAIVKFTLKDNSDNAVNATKLTVTAGETTINVTPASATNVLYVAIPAISSQTVYLSATAGGANYIYEKADVTLDNGKYYGFKVSMEEFTEPLTFEAKVAGATVTFTDPSETRRIQYSIDGGSTWTDYVSPITLANVGDKVYFRGSNPSYGVATLANCSSFSCSEDCYIYGNVMSLIGSSELSEPTNDYAFNGLFRNNTKIFNHPSKPVKLSATTLSKSCYQYMFNGCTNLTNSPVLPATTLAESCYGSMFYGCTSLTTVPELPATTLANFCYGGMFRGCTSLTAAPELPATTLANFCYGGMFAGCTSLTTAPELPATTLATGCYSEMFYGCTSLTTAPELPATSLASSCYINMFRGCTSLTTAPALPSTTLDYSCYSRMFNDCTSLTTAPELPATTLAMKCYESMFEGCTSLTTAPELPATTLATYCYSSMFHGCTSLTAALGLSATTLAESCCEQMFYGCSSLTTAPELPATTLADVCYGSMFYGCTSLNSVKCLATDITATDCTKDWLKDVPASGTFTKAPSMTSWPTGSSSGIPSGWTVLDDAVSPFSSEPLTFEAMEAGATVTFTKGTTPTNQIEYSTNGSTWTAYTSPVTLTNVGDKVYFRGNNAAYGGDDFSNCSRFSCSNDCCIYGNIMSLINPTDYVTTTVLTAENTFKYLFCDNSKIYNHSSKQLELPATTLTASCYFGMFDDCTALTTAPVLPATTLSEACYLAMFSGCTSLTNPPALPATTLTESCYQTMFKGCTALTTAPALPATTLAQSCYSIMFEDCINLTETPELPATTLAEGCYEIMFYGCTSLTTASNLPATTLATRCYRSMFGGCTSLTTPPQLSATTLSSLCCQTMFSGCTSLTTAPDLPATTLASSCYLEMFKGCTALTTAPALPATTLSANCYQSMFSGCTSLTTAPELPATTLTYASSCYSSMFSGCTSLNTVPELPATTLALSCYSSMFSGCTSLTVAPELPAATLAGYCYKEMFSGCISLNSVKCLATNISASYCTDNWLYGVSSSGTFTKASSMTSWTTGASGIPDNWTVNNE